MPTIDLNALSQLKDTELKVQIQAIYEGLYEKNAANPFDGNPKDYLLKALNELGIGPGIKSKNGAEFSHFAAEAGHAQLLKMLIYVGFNPQATYSINIGLLHNAIISGDVETVDALIEMNLDLNILDKNNLGLLHYAVYYNKIEVLHHLINKGLRLDKHDFRLLRIAAKSNHRKMLETLLEIGVKIDLSHFDKEQSTLFYEIFLKPLDVNTPAGKAKALNILAKAGINLGTKGANGLTLLHHAAGHGHVEFFNALLAIGFDKNTTNNEGFNTLILAAKNGQTEMAKTLIQAGITIEVDQLAKCEANFRKKILSTIHKLFFCIDINDPAQKDEASKALHKAVSDLSTKNNSTIFLCYVAMAGEVDLFKALIAIGFDKNATHALIYTASEGQIEIVKVLVAMGLKTSLNQLAELAKLESPNKTLLTLYEALVKPIDINTPDGKNEALNILAKAGIGREAKDDHGAGLLHLLCATGQIEIIKCLINIGFNKDILTLNGVGLLQPAVIHDHIDVIKYLMSIGLNEKVIDFAGKGLLHYAAESKTSLETIKFLISTGLDKNQRSQQDEIPLYLAVKQGDIKKVEALIALGFNKDALTKSGRSNLWFAAVGGHRKLLELLIKEYGVTDFDIVARPAQHRYHRTDKNIEAIELYNNIEQLRILHFSYLSSFGLLSEIQQQLNAVIPEKAVIDIISAYLPSGNKEEHELLEQSVIPAKRLRKMLLVPLLNFCQDNPANEKAKTELKRLLDLKKLGIPALETELDILLNDLLNSATPPSEASFAYIAKLIECRHKTAEITGNKLTIANDNLAVLQGRLDFEDKKADVEIYLLKILLKNFYSFQFKCLCVFAALNTATLALSLLALCAFNPIVLGIAVTSVGAINLASTFYNLYQHNKIIKNKNTNGGSMKDPLEVSELLNTSLLPLPNALKKQQEKVIQEQQKSTAHKDLLKANYAFQFKFLCACGTISSATAILGILTIAAFNPVIAAITLTVSVASLLGTSYGFYSNYKDAIALDPNKKLEPASSKKTN